MEWALLIATPMIRRLETLMFSPQGSAASYLDEADMTKRFHCVFNIAGNIKVGGFLNFELEGKYPSARHGASQNRRTPENVDNAVGAPRHGEVLSRLIVQLLLESPK